MDWRIENFRKKFNSAAQSLGVLPHEIVSLKLRENVNSYSEYRDFLQALERQTGLRSSRVDGELQGNGHLITDGSSKIIFVEHESGLEILYVAGSIASLISLVPLVVQGWRAFRGRHRVRPDFDEARVEIRRMDEQGQLIENPNDDAAVIGFSPFGLNASLMSAVKITEDELLRLRQEVASLTKRVEKLETEHSRGTAGENASFPRPSNKIAAVAKELCGLIEKRRHTELSQGAEPSRKYNKKRICECVQIFARCPENLVPLL